MIVFTTFTTIISLLAGGLALSVATLKGLTYSISLRKQIAENFKVLKEVHNQLTPNSGESLRDAIDRLEDTTKKVRKDLDEYHKTQSGI